MKFLMDRWLHARLIYPAIVRLRGEGALFAELERMRALEKGSPEQLRREREQALAKLLNWASRSVPFYRERWPGLTVVDAETAAEALVSLPFLAKADLQHSADRLRSEGSTGRETAKSTGGSTAEPVTVVKNRSGLAMERAASWLGYGWFGIEPGDRGARFWGTPLTSRKRADFAVADFAMHRIRFSAFDLEDADLEGYWERCLAYRPRWFYGYTAFLDYFAAYLERSGRNGRRLELKAVVTTAEPLDEEQRDRLERVFGAPVQNEYGCGETGAIAYGCELGSLHIMAMNVWAEVIRDDGTLAMPGEEGEVTVTDLTNYAMPLVRYRLGDRAVQGSLCACGRPWPTLRKVWGRVYDELYTPAGRRWHGEKVKYLMVQLHGEIGGFDQFQIVQDGPDTLDVRLVSDCEIPGEIEHRITEYVHSRLDGFRARVRRVDAVERSRSGKLRVVRNDWLSAISEE